MFYFSYKDTDETATKPGLEYTKPEKNFGQFYKQLINVNNIKEPNSQTYMIACIGLAIFSTYYIRFIAKISYTNTIVQNAVKQTCT